MERDENNQNAWIRVGRAVEVGVVRTVQVLLMIMTVSATIVLAWLVVSKLFAATAHIGDSEELHQALQKGFAGVLVVLLGLELLDTTRLYFAEHANRVRAILVVALIAVGRHIVQLDFDHVEARLLIGLAVLMLALSAGLVLVKKADVA